MIRGLFTAISISAAAWAFTLAVAPQTLAEPEDVGCTELSYNGTCVYKNCTDAKAHGRCNITQDDPAYCAKQDRDGDGLACEC
ncbi:excalibur calcium-binding domain-containing protein [Mycobacterium bourgelatii]|nr:excalibur calcium-binding domain-containing protein [Mycobacterium bourgelatii]MCV6974170.1 excalibur calcium-binding domain-containing protein [Mycobacterium bourgelatii]